MMHTDSQIAYSFDKEIIGTPAPGIPVSQYTIKPIDWLTNLAQFPEYGNNFEKNHKNSYVKRL